MFLSTIKRINGLKNVKYFHNRKTPSLVIIQTREGVVFIDREMN